MLFHVFAFDIVARKNLLQLDSFLVSLFSEKNIEK